MQYGCSVSERRENKLPPFRMSINLFALKETRTVGASVFNSFVLYIYIYIKVDIARTENTKQDISADYRDRPQFLEHVKCRTLNYI